MGLDKMAYSRYNDGMIKITVRISDEDEKVYRGIEKSAQNNRRSINNEILQALDFYLKNAPQAHYEVKPLPKEGKAKK